MLGLHRGFGGIPQIPAAPVIPSEKLDLQSPGVNIAALSHSPNPSAVLPLLERCGFNSVSLCPFFRLWLTQPGSTSLHSRVFHLFLKVNQQIPPGSDLPAGQQCSTHPCINQPCVIGSVYWQLCPFPLFHW